MLSLGDGFVLQHPNCQPPDVLLCNMTQSALGRRQTGDLEATTRWTMIMRPTFNKKLGLSRFWDPTLFFTGTSIMGVNPETGEKVKFNLQVVLTHHRFPINLLLFQIPYFIVRTLEVWIISFFKE